MVRSESIIRFR